MIDSGSIDTKEVKMSGLRKKVDALPKEADDYTYKFFIESLKSSWQGVPVAPDWDLGRINWPFMMWAGRAHKIMSSYDLAWRELSSLPDEISEQVWIAYSVAEQRGRKVEFALDAVRDISDRFSIEPGVMKSPAYVKQAFGGYGLREVLDLDILVSPEDMVVLRREFKAMGFEEEKLRSQYSFKMNGTHIEAHLRPISKKRYWHLFNSSEILNRQIPMEDREGLSRLSTPDEAMLLACHAYGHSYTEALWVRDIAAWWRVRNPDIDVVHQAFKEAGLQRIGWITWRGMQRMGWVMPESWSNEAWGVTDRFDEYVRYFWENAYRGCGTSVRRLLMFRGLEYRAAIGLHAKLGVILPWVSVKRCRELYRAARGMESIPSGTWG